MSRRFDFERLVELCRQAHEETRRSAARAADAYLVTRNWLLGRYIAKSAPSTRSRRPKTSGACAN